MRGTVIEFEWANPHTWLHVARDGEADSRISFEGMSADYLGRRNWNRRTLQAGEPLEIVYFPYRDGSPGGLLVRVRQGDGTVRVMIDND